jgi:glycosyltransferase involved in cell wall biosynthesis
VDVELTPSEHEVGPIRADAPAADVRVLPPFASEPGGKAAHEDRTLSERDELLFVGGFAHVPNVDAALRLVREVMPLVWSEVPEARVRIVGDAPPPEVRALASERVAVAGWVRDLDTALGAARATVSPLRYGSGIKGKILTSLAAGVPVVTTAIGNEGLGLRDGIEVLLGETPGELAAAVVRLYQEPALAGTLAAAGRMWVSDHLSPERTRAVLLDALGLPPVARA